MRRTLVIFAVVGVCVALALAFRQARSRHSNTSPLSLDQTLREAVTNPVEFARSRLTGGVGMVLYTDPATGLTIIDAVGIGSPAQDAGLRAGDTLVGVDGLSVTGRPASQVAEGIRGLTAGQVSLTVLRDGTNRIECLVRRDSWSTLRGQSLQR
jgi:C-terminal processing protease CtpA/Prc